MVTYFETRPSGSVVNAKQERDWHREVLQWNRISDCVFVVSAFRFEGVALIDFFGVRSIGFSNVFGLWEEF